MVSLAKIRYSEMVNVLQVKACSFQLLLHQDLTLVRSVFKLCARSMCENIYIKQKQCFQLYLRVNTISSANWEKFEYSKKEITLNIYTRLSISACQQSLVKKSTIPINVGSTAMHINNGLSCSRVKRAKGTFQYPAAVAFARVNASC